MHLAIAIVLAVSACSRTGAGPNMVGEPEVVPGTRDGAACVTPASSPDRSARWFGRNREVAPGSHGARAREAHLDADAAGRVVVAFITGSRAIGWSASRDRGDHFSAPAVIDAGTPGVVSRNLGDPVVGAAPDGSFYLAWLGSNPSSGAYPADMKIYVARSTDGGESFRQIRIITSPDEQRPGGYLDKPWLGVSPSDGSLVVLWNRTLARGPVELRLGRSTDHGRTWSAPLTWSAGDERPGNDRNLAQVAFAADGRAAIVWLEAGDQILGSPDNAVYLQRLHPDGTRDGRNVRVTAGADSPVWDQPSAAFAPDGRTLHVTFVSGTVRGAWDIRAITSHDGGATFAPSVPVNDDPHCATHLHPQLAVSPDGVVHVVWYDNRYLDGNLFHAVSAPADARHPLAFGAATFVNDRPFPFTTRRDSSARFGDYLGLRAVGNDLYAAWSDGRDVGLSRVFFARATVH